MNIGFLYGLDVSSPNGGGGNVHGHFLARELVSRGHKLFSWYANNGDSEYCYHFRGREIFSFLRKIDALYIRVEWDLSSVKRGHFLKRFNPRLPVVWEFNGHPAEMLFSNKIEEDLSRVTSNLKKYSSGVDLAIGVSDEICRFVRNSIGIEKVRCIPNGSSEEIFSPSPSSESNADDPLIVVWIGTSRAGWHNLEEIVEAAKLLEARGAKVKFNIYGDPTHLPELPRNVIACGELPYHELGRQLGTANVGLHFFKQLNGISAEGSPLKIFDYMASGLAILTENRGQRGEIINRWKCGLVSTGSAEDIARKIEILERDRDLCYRLGKNGRDAVITYFNWRRVAAETEAALSEVLRKL